MTLRMADSVTPANLPPGMDAYAGYDNGRWADFAAIAAAHPGAHLLDLSVRLANVGAGGDDEPGDMTDAETVTYIQLRLAAGVWRPVAYRSISGAEDLFELAAAAGIQRTKFRFLSAHYTGTPHICGPTTCKAGPQADGTQWIDHGPWDESLLADDFFGPLAPNLAPPAGQLVAGHPTPPPLPTVINPPLPIPGDTAMFVDFRTPIGSDGSGYVDLPIPAGCAKLLGGWVDVLDATGAAPPAHDADVTAAHPTGVVCAPAVGAKGIPAGTQRLRILGAIPNHPGYTGHALFA